MENNWLIDENIFNDPFTSTLAGPTQSGKTCLLKKILIYNSILFDKPPKILFIVIQLGSQISKYLVIYILA